MRGPLSACISLSKQTALSRDTRLFSVCLLPARNENRSLLAQRLLTAGCGRAILFYVIYTPRRQFFTAF